jgi:hypothetical protein
LLQVNSVKPAPVAFLILSVYSPSIIEELVETGFDYITDVDGLKLFRRRK